MSSIIAESFAEGTFNYLTLNNEEYTRPLIAGTTWNKIRLGFLLSIQPASDITIPSAQLVIGMCNGQKYPYGSNATTNFIGCAVTFSSAATTGDDLTFSSGPNRYTLGGGASSGNAAGMLKRVAGVSTVGSASSTALIIPTSEGLARRGVLYLEIEKASPNYHLQIYGFIAGTSVTERVPIGGSSSGLTMADDFSYANWLSYLQDTTMSTDFHAGTLTDVATDEIAGAFDTVDILWNKASDTLRLYDVGVFRLS